MFMMLNSNFAMCWDASQYANKLPLGKSPETPFTNMDYL